MKVFVDVHDARWKKFKINFQKIADQIVAPEYKDAEVSIVLTDDKEIHAINKEYRNIDKPTNVLSFELGDDVLMGDIYISFDTVMREAKNDGVSFEKHVAHMVVHGILHLMGYDHIENADAVVMEQKEIEILKKMGIENPYDDGCKSCEVVCKNRVLQYALYAVFGGIAAFGFAPFYQWWWTIFGIAGAYWLTLRDGKKYGFWRTLIHVAPFGALYAIANFWWVLHSIYVIPELTEQFAIWTLPGIIGLGLAGIFIFSWPFVAIARIKTSDAARPFLFAGVWMIVLWAREWMFTGFPWNPIANITMPLPMVANSMSLWGAIGLTFVIVGMIAAVVEVVHHRRCNLCRWALLVWATLFVVGAGVGYLNMRYADAGADSVTGPVFRIVQPADSQEQKATHDPDQYVRRAEKNLRNLVRMAGDGAQNFDVVIFPETTYPYYVRAGDTDFELARALDRYVVTGANSVSVNGVSNSMVVADERGRVQTIYSKSHLVPFGEYSPMGFLPSPVNLVPGDGARVIAMGDFVFVPAICYEIVFSDSLVPRDAGVVHAIINITNDNWFGNTPGTYQHLDMVRRYAIESGLPVVRANYSGVSAFVASDGMVVSKIPVGQAGVIDGFVWGTHMTPYRHLGMNVWFIIMLVIACLGAIGFGLKTPRY